MELFSLKGKVAIITGGNGGLGRGMAQGLAAAGANIVIAARNKAKTATTAAELRNLYGIQTLEAKVDVCLEADVKALMAQTVDTFNRLDILVNNAGTNIRKPPEELSQSDWQTVIDTNLKSALLCSQAAYQAMVQNGGGKIINNGSMFSIFGGSHVLAYAASKGGVVQLTKSLAVAWAKDNIQVNAILPGWRYTDLTNRAMAVFFASKASDFVTGVALPVDGGYSIMAP
jgi:2-deoxy-D-gluconate 3-dehydrogenase